jgi:hypothetical protein
LSSRTTTTLHIAALFYRQAVWQTYTSIQKTSGLLSATIIAAESCPVIWTSLYFSSHRIQYVIAASPGLVPPSYVRSFALVQLFQDSVETCRLAITKPPFSVTLAVSSLNGQHIRVEEPITTSSLFWAAVGSRTANHRDQHHRTLHRYNCTCAWTGATQPTGHRLRFRSATSTRHVALFERYGGVILKSTRPVYISIRTSTLVTCK